MTMATVSSLSVRPASAGDLYYNIWSEYSDKASSFQARHQPASGLFPMDWSSYKVSRLLQGIQTAQLRQTEDTERRRCRSAAHSQHYKNRFEVALSTRSGRDSPQTSPCENSGYLRRSQHCDHSQSNDPKGMSMLTGHSPTQRHCRHRDNLPSILKTIQYYNQKYRIVSSSLDGDPQHKDLVFVERESCSSTESLYDPQSKEKENSKEYCMDDRPESDTDDEPEIEADDEQELDMDGRPEMDESPKDDREDILSNTSSNVNQNESGDIMHSDEQDRSKSPQ